MRMILIYALAKRDQISGSGRAFRFALLAFFAYNTSILTERLRHDYRNYYFIFNPRAWCSIRALDKQKNPMRPMRRKGLNKR